MKKLNFLIICTVFISQAYPQTSNQIAKMIPEINVVALNEIAISEKQNSLTNKNDAINWANINNYPIKGSIGSQQFEIKGLINNRPLYFSTQNTNAAKSI